MTFADDPPPTPPITTSYGSTWTIETFDQSVNALNKSETRINARVTDGIELRNQANSDAYKMGMKGDKAGLETLIANITATLAAGKKPAIGITVAFVTGVLNNLKLGGKFGVYLDWLNKWGKIEANNQEITNAVSDHDMFYELFEKWWVHKEGPNNPVPGKDNTRSVSSMQTPIPALGVRCAGACNAWWYNDSWYFESMLSGGAGSITDPITGVTGTRVSTSELSDLATSHQTGCDGCGDGYWTCREEQVKEHQVLYCGKSITWYTYDRLSGKWGKYSLGICGASYRGCDDPQKTAVHHYRPVMQGGQDSWGNWGYYITSYRGDPLTAHGSGSKSATASINGPGGSGIPPGRMDDSSNCDKCMDSSRFCPDASTRH